MKERPILFNDVMVRAILDGRKTQTRRAVKPAYVNDNGYRLHEVVHGEAARKLTGPNDRAYVGFGHPSSCSPSYFGCPYGQPGDRLWVRECFDATGIEQHPTRYRADHRKPDMVRWTPSIHMPRWASRITLEITGVRVERLQEISEADALEEGITYNDIPNNGLDPMRARTWFRGLWESINGPGSWGANPWVWVVEFRRLP